MKKTDRRHMNNLEKLEQFKVAVEGADVDDAATFHDLIRQAFALRVVVSDEDVARKFAMSRPSVNRWKNGRTAPHPAVRRPVYAWLAKEARRAIEMERKSGRASAAAVRLK
jgi:DNA-binding transcriptional regulator YdaS (Cro superfamily)